jgi:hypothetical protein
VNFRYIILQHPECEARIWFIRTWRKTQAPSFHSVCLAYQQSRKTIAANFTPAPVRLQIMDMLSTHGTLIDAACSRELSARGNKGTPPYWLALSSVILGIPPTQPVFCALPHSRQVNCVTMLWNKPRLLPKMPQPFVSFEILSSQGGEDDDVVLQGCDAV